MSHPEKTDGEIPPIDGRIMSDEEVAHISEQPEPETPQQCRVLTIIEFGNRIPGATYDTPYRDA